MSGKGYESTHDQVRRLVHDELPFGRTVPVGQTGTALRSIQEALTLRMVPAALKKCLAEIYSREDPAEIGPCHEESAIIHHDNVQLQHQ